MNIRLIYKILTLFLLVVAVFMALPSVVAAVYGETHLIPHFLIPSLAVIALSAVSFLTIKPKSTSLLARDIFLLANLAWFGAILVCSIPFITSGEFPSVIDAIFETASGFTTTGASILTEIEDRSRSILFWRSMTHWLGGMGIISLAVAVFPLFGVSGLPLLRAEMPGPDVEKLTPRITRTALILWLIYLSFTVAETALLMLGGLDLYDALTHTFGTLATGGFSPYNNSIAAFDSAYVQWVITVFMLLAGVNFVLHFRLITLQFRHLARNSELKAYLLIFFTATILVTASIHGEVYESIYESMRYGAFQVASLMTTTGYVTADYDLWPALGKAALFIMFFVGGSVGSTGGGIKVMRVLSLAKQAFVELKYLLYPKGVFRAHINGAPVNKMFLYSVTGFVFLYFSMLLVTTLFVASSGTELLSSFSASLAIVGNVGPGFGEVGPTQNYALFPDYVKAWLSIAMVVGRLEIFTVIIIFTPTFWRR
ncbi:MAG: TrkH family potassium uptake protein [Spirochaetaceae bacterium]